MNVEDHLILFVGGASVQLHMINEESRKYFQRAFSMSGSALQYYVLWAYNNNREEQIQNCAKTNDTQKIIELLKTASGRALLNCNKPGWNPTIESTHTKDAFLTQSPDDIYNSSEAPIIDTMFSFASKVSHRFQRQ